MNRWKVQERYTKGMFGFTANIRFIKTGEVIRAARLGRGSDLFTRENRNPSDLKEQPKTISQTVFKADRFHESAFRLHAINNS